MSHHAAALSPPSPDGSSSAGASVSQPSTPTLGNPHKRRRVSRACDECRHKKVKCNGSQPCTHCVVYGYDCTFEEPSSRRRNPPPKYVKALENKLERAQLVLRCLLPDHTDLESIDIDSLSPVQAGSATSSQTPRVSTESASVASPRPSRRPSNSAAPRVKQASGKARLDELPDPDRDHAASSAAAAPRERSPPPDARIEQSLDEPEDFMMDDTSEIPPMSLEMNEGQRGIIATDSAFDSLFSDYNFFSSSAGFENQQFGTQSSMNPYENQFVAAGTGSFPNQAQDMGQSSMFPTSSYVHPFAPSMMPPPLLHNQNLESAPLSHRSDFVDCSPHDQVDDVNRQR